MLLHYLGKLYIQIFCRYLADMEKMLTNCISSTPILIPLYACNCVFWVYLCVFIKIFTSLNTMLIVDEHRCDVCCDEFSVPQIDRNVKQAKEQWHEKCICDQYGGKLAILNAEIIKICGLITKLEATKMQFVCIFYHICRISAKN